AHQVDMAPKHLVVTLLETAKHARRRLDIGQHEGDDATRELRVGHRFILASFAPRCRQGSRPRVPAAVRAAVRAAAPPGPDPATAEVRTASSHADARAAGLAEPFER